MKPRANLFAWGLLGLSLLISLGISLGVREWELEQLRQEFAHSAEEGLKLLQMKLEQDATILYSIQSFFASSREVGREEFRTFAEETLPRHPEMVFLQWIARVPAAERALFEESVRQEGFPDFQITEQDARGRQVRASDRQEYFPIHYGEPSETARAVLGFDLGSERVRREALELARDTGELVATPWIPLLVSSAQDPMGFLLFLPIYRNGTPHETLEERRQNLAGFALAIYRVGGMLEVSLRGWERGKIEVYLQPHESGEEKNLLYEYNPEGEVSWLDENYQEHRQGEPETAWRGEIRVGGQRWILTAHPTAEYLSGQRRGFAAMALAVGLLASLLIFGTLRNIMGYAARVEQLVERRTQTLSRELEQRHRLERQVQQQVSQLSRANQELEERETAAHRLLEDLSRSQQRQEKQNQELKEREAMMHSLLEDLTSSKERLEETTRQIQMANEQLRKLSQAKDEFVAKVSHELRTPLTSIKEGLNLMLDGALGPTTETQVDFIKTMDKDIDRLTELINNMLDLSKIEAGRMRLNRRRVGLAELIASTIKSYQAISLGRTVTHKSEPVPDVFADSNRILQVLGNLFSNAMKYGKPDGRIQFILEPHDGMVAVRVQDDGEGIPPDALPKLFQKFSRIQHQGQEIQGTGLGLVVCKELAELHGGRIEVQSTVGQGSVFSVLLPPYSDNLALNESFLELTRHETSGKGEPVGLIVARTSGASADDDPKRAEGLAEEIQRRLHRGDIVLSLSSGWVVVLAAVDLQGVQAVLQRLREQMPERQNLEFGFALYPEEGRDGEQLFQQAVQKACRQRVPS